MHSFFGVKNLLKGLAKAPVMYRHSDKEVPESKNQLVVADKLLMANAHILAVLTLEYEAASREMENSRGKGMST